MQYYDLYEAIYALYDTSHKVTRVTVLPELQSDVQSGARICERTDRCHDQEGRWHSLAEREVRVSVILLS